VICYKIAVGEYLMWQNTLTEKLAVHASYSVCKNEAWCSSYGSHFGFSNCMHPALKTAADQ